MSNEEVISPVKTRLEFRNKGTKRDPDYKFISWSKELEQEVPVKVEKFLMISESYRLEMFTKTEGGEKKGYFSHSNFIEKLKEDKITLKDKETWDVVFDKVWDYKDCPAGARLVTYVLALMDWELVQVKLIPSQAKSLKFIYKKWDKWRPFSDRYDYWVEVTGKEFPNEDAMYEVPTFKIGEKKTEEDTKKVDEYKKDWEIYMNAVKEKRKAYEQAKEIDDSLPF